MKINMPFIAISLRTIVRNGVAVKCTNEKEEKNVAATKAAFFCL